MFSLAKVQLSCDFLCMFNFRPKPFTFKGDHKYPVSNPESPVIIMYAEIGSSAFSKYHKLLVSKTNAGEITYILRHYIAVSTIWFRKDDVIFQVLSKLFVLEDHFKRPLS